MATALLDAKKIRTDGGTQHREAPNEAVIAEYSELLLDEVELPPVEIVFDGKNYWLWDGFHRLAAYILAGIRSVSVNVTKGTLQDAFRLSLAANKAHGLRRSNETKRRAVQAALENEETAAMKDREIARLIGVSNHLVASMRKGEERVVHPAKKPAAAAASSGNVPRSEPETERQSGGEQTDLGLQGGEAQHPEREPGPARVVKPGVATTGSVDKIVAERDQLREQLDAVTAMCEDLIAEVDVLRGQLEAKDHGAASLAAAEEIKKLRAQLRVAEERFNGANAERNEAVRHAKGLANKVKQGKKK